MIAIVCHDGVLDCELRTVEISASEINSMLLAVKDPVLNILCFWCVHEENLISETLNGLMWQLL